MVGVPRSQGCRNCKRKKKGCDQNRPICGQCAKVKSKCTYDERQWTFVSHDRLSGTTATASAESTSRSKVLPSEHSLAVTQSPSLVRTAQELQVVGAFWTAYWPRENAAESIGGITTSPWVETLRYFAAQDHACRIAMDACAFTALGRMHDDEMLVQQGTRLYTCALVATNQALQHVERAQTDAVLALCRILGLYETFRGDTRPGTSSQGTDWHRHVDGTCRLIELRGPERHVATHARTLFSESRGSAMISGVARRRPNAFSNGDWLTVPWWYADRTLREELHDIMLLLPGIMQSFDSNQRYSEDPHVLRGEGLLTHCLSVAKSLHQWEQKTIQLARASLGNATSTADLRDCCTHFNYGFFHVVMHYWTACLILYSSTWLLFRRLQSEGVMKGDVRPPRVPDPQTYASNISTYCFHYFKPEAGLWGTQNASFAMGAALHFYAATGQQESPYQARMRLLFSATKQGSLTSQFLRSMAASVNAPSRDPGNRNEHSEMAREWYGLDRMRQSEAATA